VECLTVIFIFFTVVFDKIYSKAMKYRNIEKHWWSTLQKHIFKSFHMYSRSTRDKFKEHTVVACSWSALPIKWTPRFEVVVSLATVDELKSWNTLFSCCFSCSLLMFRFEEVSNISSEDCTVLCFEKLRCCLSSPQQVQLQRWLNLD
jgi:hypothetical protein